MHCSGPRDTICVGLDRSCVDGVLHHCWVEMGAPWLLRGCLWYTQVVRKRVGQKAYLYLGILKCRSCRCDTSLYPEQSHEQNATWTSARELARKYHWIHQDGLAVSVACIRKEWNLWKTKGRVTGISKVWTNSPYDTESRRMLTPNDWLIRMETTAWRNGIWWATIVVAPRTTIATASDTYLKTSAASNLVSSQTATIKQSASWENEAKTRPTDWRAYQREKRTRSSTCQAASLANNRLR